MKIILNHVTFEYDDCLPNYSKALDDINLVINEGEFLAITGRTGSGKSTMIQLMNGLLNPSSGNVYFEGEDINEKGYDKKILRSKIGLLFQYPEHQLFADTVFEDVCFGPLNTGFDRKAAELAAYDALKTMEIPDELFYQSPFDMSGGQMRRVAIAGILAMKPEVFILDEPSAGLDPGAARNLLNLIKKLNKEKNITVVLITHNMDDIAEYADKVVVLDNGRKILDGRPVEVFKQQDILKNAGLDAPQIVKLVTGLADSGFPIDPGITGYEEAKEAIINAFKLK